jgi:hypothetical protein
MATRYLQLVWSALWRAQVVHLVLFVGAPVLLGLLKLLLSIVFLPFLLLSFGDTKRDEGSSHLQEIGCWVALAPCSVAHKPLMNLPSPQSASPEPTAPSLATEAPDPLAEFPSALTPRHVWFFAWLVWFLLYIVRANREPPHKRDA